MNAEEFLKGKGVTRLTCYTNESTYYIDGLCQLFEEYAALNKVASSQPVIDCPNPESEMEYQRDLIAELINMQKHPNHSTQAWKDQVISVAKVKGYGRKDDL